MNDRMEKILCFIAGEIYYLVHDLVVGSGQNEVHGLHVLSEFEVAWMLTILCLTKDLASCFGFLNIQ